MHISYFTFMQEIGCKIDHAVKREVVVSEKVRLRQRRAGLHAREDRLSSFLLFKVSHLQKKVLN